MDEDKINKTIEILLQNQVQFYVDLQKTQEAQARSEKNIDNLHEISRNLFEAVKLTNDAVKQTNENFNLLSDKVDKMADNIDKLTDAQKETDERLNAVIFMAERFFSRENGKSE